MLSILAFEITVEPGRWADLVGADGPPGTREFLAALLES